MVEGDQPALFVQLLVVFVGSLTCLVLFQRLRLPTMLAYVAAGALIGAHGFGWAGDIGDIRFLSSLGLVFLLFDLGLEFSLRQLLSLGLAVFGLGSLQVTLTIVVLACGLFFFLEQSLTSSLVLAGSLALSSTAIVVHELKVLKLVNRHHAQLAVGILVFQDLAAVIGLILVQAFAGNMHLSLYEQVAVTLGKGAVLVAILVSVGKWILPHVFHEIARAESDAIFVLTVLVIALMSAWLTHAFGLSMALGAFLTGMMLGESEFRHQVELDIRPFKDILMGLFFATVGMSIDFTILATQGGTVLIGVLILIALKTAIVIAVAMLMGEGLRTATKTGLILAQASEFGFALMSLGLNLQVVPVAMGSLVSLVALGSMIATPWLIRYSFEISQLLARLVRQDEIPHECDRGGIPAQLADHVILAGYGRVGQMVAKFLRANDIPFIALDTDSQTVKRGRAAGDLVIYGSCERIELLRRCRIERARLAILTFNSLKQARRVIAQIRALDYSVPIIVRTQNNDECNDLLAAGADHVIAEMFESSLVMAAEALNLLGFPKPMIEEQVDIERKSHTRAKEASLPK